MIRSLLRRFRYRLEDSGRRGSGPRPGMESAFVVSDCLIRGLDDGSILFTSPDGGPLTGLRIAHCNLDGAGFLGGDRAMFVIHWDLDRLLSSDAVIRLLIDTPPGVDVDDELEAWLDADSST